jgi:hypothetical protein
MGQLFEAKVKQISEGEAAYSLREAWKKLYGEYPSLNSLALLWSQWALETGRGKSIWNYNFGNIKVSGDEDYTMYRCNEVINGKVEWFDPPHKQTWFRSYGSAIDGAYDYIKFLSQKSRYKAAWQAIIKGDPAIFSHELKVAGYYTAEEEGYTHNVVSLTTEFKSKADTILTWQPEKIYIPQIEVELPGRPAPELENEPLSVPKFNILDSIVKMLDPIFNPKSK